MLFNARKRIMLTHHPLSYSVGPTGLEPIMTEPKPVVLPLHHGPIPPIASAKVVFFRSTTKFYALFFSIPIIRNA